MSTEKNLPMDPTAAEGQPTIEARPRNTYALRRLITEVEALMPGIAYEVSNRDGRGVAHDVQFDLSSVLPEDRADFITLLSLMDDPAYSEDRRIGDIVTDTEYVLVSFRTDPRTQDDPSPFGIAEAWSVLRGDSL